MDYCKIYSNIVASCQRRGLDKTKLEGYFEVHHIIPRCIGGDDSPSNLVLLTAREHFIIHRLLAKIYPDVTGLQLAIIMMSRSSKLRGSKWYEKARQVIVDNLRGENAPSFKDFTGTRFGKLIVVGLAGWRRRERDGCHESRWLCECDCGNYKEVAGKNLQQGTTKSCGCLVKETYPRQLPNGQRAEYRGDTYKYKSGRDSWDCKKYDRPWKSPAIMKYEHNVSKWYLADYYYGCFINLCDAGSSDHIFWKSYKESHNDDVVKKNYFSLMVSMFNKGWIPKEDPEWILYKCQYEEALIKVYNK